VIKLKGLRGGIVIFEQNKWPQKYSGDSTWSNDP